MKYDKYLPRFAKVQERSLPLHRQDCFLHFVAFKYI